MKRHIVENKCGGRLIDLIIGKLVTSHSSHEEAVTALITTHQLSPVTANLDHILNFVICVSNVKYIPILKIDFERNTNSQKFLQNLI